MITLDQAQLKHYVHLGANALDPEEELSEDEQYITHQVGLFFSNNLWLADYATKIEEVVLEPRGEKTPPLAMMRLPHHGRTYTLTSNDEGVVPVKPWRRRGPRRRRR